MAGKFSFSPSDYQEAAIKYRKELLYLPIIGCNDTLQYMTARPGIRYKERVGNITGDAQFAPYNPARSKDFDLHLSFRETNQRDGSFGLPLAYVWCAYGMQTKSYYVCSGNVVWGWRWR